MVKFNPETENRIDQAICALKTQKKPNISKAAREFNVPRTTLQSRWQGRLSLKNRAPTNLKLNSTQDKALCRYLDTLERYRIKPLKRMIEAAANAILKASHNDPETPPPTVGPKWLHRWLQRHPQYKKRWFRAIELDRKHAEDRQLLRQWFKELEDVILKYGITPEDIQNFDETGFQIGIGKDQWVITRDIKTEKPYISINSEREYVTVVEAVNAVS
jgi:hypothetical protein